MTISKKMSAAPTACVQSQQPTTLRVPRISNAARPAKRNIPRNVSRETLRMRQCTLETCCIPVDQIIES